MNGILVSQLDVLEVPHDLHVDDSKVIVDGLVENHVINQLLDLLSLGSDSLNSIDVDVLKKLVNLLMIMDLVNQGSKELNQWLIVILDAKEEAIKQRHWVLLNVAWVFTDAVDDFQVKVNLSISLFST